MPEELAERREGQGWVLREETSAEDLVDRYAVDGPDGIRFLQLGKLPGHVRPGTLTAFRHVVENFRRDDWSVIGDLAAGTRQASFGWAGFATLVAVVAEPTRTALLSARRLRGILASRPQARVGLIVNKARDEAQAQALADELSLPLWATIPDDAAIADAEREGLAPLDVAAGAPAIVAMVHLTASLCEIEAQRASA